jgi:hypothetical protein
VLRFGIAAGLFCRFLFQPLISFTLSLFRQTALLFAVTVKILIHQQSHFVVCFELGRQLLIELDVHLQRFGVQRVHGFFSLNAFLLGFPFMRGAVLHPSARPAAHAQCGGFRRSASAGFKLTRSGVVNAGFGTNLMRHGCEASRPLRVDVRHQAASFFLDRLNNRVELLFGGEYRHCVLFLDDD